MKVSGEDRANGQNPIQPAANNNPEEEQYEQNQEDDGRRKIARVLNFDTGHVDCQEKEPGYEPGKKWKTLDGGYLTVKGKLGEGAFCKVKEAVCKVNRVRINKETGQEELVPGL